MRQAVILATLLALSTALSAPAATPLSKVRYAPDVTTVLSGVTVSPSGPAEDDLAGTVTFPSVGTIPAGARLDGYALHPNGFQYLSFDTAVTLSGTTFLRNDVVQYDGASYTLSFSSSAQGVPDGVDLRDFAFDVAGTSLYLVFDSAFTVSGTTYTPRDVVLWNGVSFSKAFDGVAAGIDPGLALDGIEALPSGDLLLSFDGSGSIGGVSFDDEDVLEYTPGAPGTWQMAYDGSAAQPSGWPPADLSPLAACATPAAPSASYDMSVCQGGTLKLLAATTEPNVSFSWTGPNGFTSSLQNPTIPNASSLQNGTYTVTISRIPWTGCAAANNVGVTIPADGAAPMVTAPTAATVTQTLCM